MAGIPTASKEAKAAVAERASVDEGTPDRDERASIADEEEDDASEHELEFETPFGRVEFEFEPRAVNEKKQRRKRDEKERKAAAEAKKKEAQLRAKAEAAALKSGRGGGKLLPILIIFALIVVATAIAIWLFARPVEDLDQVPEELRAAETEPASEAPQGLFDKLKARVREAIHAGQRASRDAQIEQERRFHELRENS